MNSGHPLKHLLFSPSGIFARSPLPPVVLALCSRHTASTARAQREHSARTARLQPRAMLKEGGHAPLQRCTGELNPAAPLLSNCPPLQGTCLNRPSIRHPSISNFLVISGTVKEPKGDFCDLRSKNTNFGPFWGPQTPMLPHISTGADLKAGGPGANFDRP